MKKAFLIYILGLILILSGCTGGKTGESSSKTIVYTTVYPLQYFTEQIGGKAIEVETIYPPGSDEHTFEPSQKDMMKLADSDLFIFIGLGLEGFVEKAKDTLKNENVKMVAAGENLEFVHSDANHDPLHEEDAEDHEAGVEDGHDHGDIDPHVWLDPLYSKELAEAIKDALVEQMPDQKEQFEQNYLELAQELDNLHNDFEQTIQSAKHQEFIVSHAAYGYWEDRYGLDQISVSGLNSSSEPTQKELQKIIAEAKEHDLKYVFFEQNVSSRLTEILQKEIGASPLLLHNLSVLTEEDLKENQTYFTLMQDNLAALKKALNE
ncbi:MULTISPECIES: metal ABC transporter substrate-binding protein [Cytobacillus]|uniref:metal ABC transporter substrate-binding protein n=1 Tax=Cytobacillus TaxID=2675230 RepID=UPI00203E3892|nr:metal ABC transporter substrate-binding protein [Cytobacillus firmus]MCM3707634.1 metal ABC transporter substrate-binding protein [Cytobacillus firmus]